MPTGDLGQSARKVGDVLLATTMVAAPAWVPWLSQVNQVLTAVTLLLGIAFSAFRLWALYAEWRSRRRYEKREIKRDEERHEAQ